MLGRPTVAPAKLRCCLLASLLAPGLAPLVASWRGISRGTVVQCNSVYSPTQYDK